MHDQLLAFVNVLATHPSMHTLAADDGSSQIKTGLIAGAALVLAAAVPSLLGRREKEPKVLADLRQANERERIAIERDRDEERKRADAAEAEVQRLLRIMTSHDPPVNPYPPPENLPS